MKKVLYKCINKECEYEFVGSAKKDGTNCPRCNGYIVLLREATYEDINKNTIPRASRKIPMAGVKKPRSIEFTIDLKGSDNVKASLNDIEKQLDRIISKQKQIRRYK